MSSIASEYELWFGEGHRDLAEFLSGREVDDDAFRDCVLTDQHLRHQSDEPLEVSWYAAHIDRVAADESLQLELWLEEVGYMEERSGETGGQFPQLTHFRDTTETRPAGWMSADRSPIDTARPSSPLLQPLVRRSGLWEADRSS